MTLGDVNLLHDEEIVNLCDHIDCALITNKICLIVERPRRKMRSNCVDSL